MRKLLAIISALITGGLGIALVSLVPHAVEAFGTGFGHGFGFGRN